MDGNVKFGLGSKFPWKAEARDIKTKSATSVQTRKPLSLSAKLRAHRFLRANSSGFLAQVSLALSPVRGLSASSHQLLGWV
jgi:hypothetical protein